MTLRTHEKNIGQIKACLNAGYSEVWVHGSGDIFPVFQYNPNEPDGQDHSKNHAENFNRGFEENAYRVKINATNLPKNKADLDRLLMNAFAQQDALKAEQSVNKSKVTNVRVIDEINEPEGIINYERYVGKK